MGKGQVSKWLSSAEQRERRQMKQERQASSGLWRDHVLASMVHLPLRMVGNHDWVQIWLLMNNE